MSTTCSIKFPTQTLKMPMSLIPTAIGCSWSKRPGGDDDDDDYDYAPAASAEGGGDDDDVDYDYAPAAWFW